MTRRKAVGIVLSLLALLIVAAVYFSGFRPGAHDHTQSPDHEDHSAHLNHQDDKKTADEPRVAVKVPREQQERIGLQTTVITEKPLQHTIRTVGTVQGDERREAHVHSRVNGWIEEIFVDYVGKTVTKGQPLFGLYSPELVATQEEYIAARRQGEAGAEIARAALDRLRLLGVPQDEISRLARTRKKERLITFKAPIDGYVVNKMAIQGMYVTPEMELYHIADLSVVWVIPSIYEADLAAIRVGDTALVSLPYDPSVRYEGKITYIFPEVDPQTRTARARVEVVNKDLVLRPGMFADIEIKKELGARVTVPEDSVIDTGTRSLVFVQTDEQRFEPREVRLGPRVGREYIVVSGIKPGDQVVTGANFLIDSESKLQAAIERGAAAPVGHGGH